METAASTLPDTNAPRVTRAAISTVFALAEQWGLTRAELATLLGVRSVNTLENWRRKPPATLSPDTLERVSYLLHIHRSLAQLFDAETGVAWLRGPNDGDPFLGTAPLDYLLRGQVRHLLDTHRYLRAFASGAF